MPEVVADTSPLQYLFQLGLLQLLPDLYGEVAVPVGVVQEVRSGLARGVALPDLDSLPWLRIRETRNATVLPSRRGSSIHQLPPPALSFATSLRGEAPNRRLNSRLNCEALP